MYENSFNHPFLIGRMGEVLVKTEPERFYDESEGFEERLYSMNEDAMSNQMDESDEDSFYFYF